MIKTTASSVKIIGLRQFLKQGIGNGLHLFLSQETKISRIVTVAVLTGDENHACGYPAVEEEPRQLHPRKRPALSNANLTPVTVKGIANT
jgi:hypothetical protein